MRILLFLLALLLASLIFFAPAGSSHVVYAVSDTSSCQPGTVYMEPTATNQFGSCAIYEYSPSSCLGGIKTAGNSNPETTETKFTGSAIVDAYGNPSCTSGTTFDWTGSGNALTDSIVAGASDSAGGVVSAQGGEWNTVQAFGSCPGNTSLGPCIEFKWSGKISASATGSPGTSGVNANFELAYWVNYVNYYGVVGGPPFALGSVCAEAGGVSSSCPASASLDVSGSYVLTYVTLHSGDYISWGQYVSVSMGTYNPGSGTGSASADPTLVSLAPCASGQTSGCVYFGPTAAQQASIPTPVFPFGSIMAISAPLLGLVSYILLRGKLAKRAPRV